MAQQMESAATGVAPETRVLLAILDNQISRTAAALEGLDPSSLDAAWDGECHSIRGIIGHLHGLRAFQLSLLQSPLQSLIPKLEPAASLDEIERVLREAAELVRRALEAHDPADWFAVPSEARPGPWGNDPTVIRFTRPLNDFTNHLGALRAMRRIRGNPAARTQ